MNAKSFVVMIAALLLVGLTNLLTGCSSQSLAQTSTKAQQWEYIVVDVEGWMRPAPGDNLVDPDIREKLATMAADRLNKLGLDGWEYAGPSLSGNFFNVVFKRPRR